MTKRTASDDLDSLELLPARVAEKRTTDLLRNLLNAPPDPRTAPIKKVTKRAHKKQGARNAKTRRAR